MSSDDRVGETTRFTYRPSTEWYWFPQQKPNEVSMLKCYDSVTDRVGTQPDIRNETISQHAVADRWAPGPARLLFPPLYCRRSAPTLRSGSLRAASCRSLPR